MITNTREPANPTRPSGPVTTHAPKNPPEDGEPAKPPRGAGKFALLVFALPVIILIVMAYLERRP
ncbi:MAG: hypothetical protein ABIK96_08345 [bacterium]|nr:hypothetical protein [bacterium]